MGKAGVISPRPPTNPWTLRGKHSTGLWDDRAIKYMETAIKYMETVLANLEVRKTPELRHWTASPSFAVQEIVVVVNHPVPTLVEVASALQALLLAGGVPFVITFSHDQIRNLHPLQTSLVWR